MGDLVTFNTVEVLRKGNNSITNIKFENASMLLTGNYLIVITKESFDTYESSIHNVFNLSEIKSYKTK